MVVLKLNQKVQKKAERVFELKGTLKIGAEAMGIDRSTIRRVVKNGTGEERTVNAITEYVKSMRVA